MLLPLKVSSRAKPRAAASLRSRARARASTLLLLSLLVCIAIAPSPSASAIEIAGVSHRTRLYDSAVHGKDLFVVGHPGTVLRSGRDTETTLRV